MVDFAAYPLSRLQLNVNGRSALQGMSTALPLCLNSSRFNFAPGKTETFVCLTHFDRTDGSVIFPVSLAPGSTGRATLFAVELAARRAYSREPIFSDRVLVAGDGANSAPQVGFNLRASGDISTAAALPEVQTRALLLSGPAVLDRRVGPRRSASASARRPT